MLNPHFPKGVPTRVWLLAAALWLVCHAPAARALSFSAQPTNQEFFAAHIFEDPLVPIGTTTASDNAALAQALVAFSQRSQAEDYSALTTFLSAYPQSPWRASLLTGMGIVYAHHGYFTRALDAWQTAWTLSKDSTGFLERGVADRALSERARLYVRLGTAASLQQLIKDSNGRELMGSARDRLRVSTEMLHFMVAKPDHAFRCGPFSLDAIGRYANPHQAYNPALIDVDDNPALAPTKDGLSLSQVRQVAQNVGLNYRMAKRPTGATLPLPAVIHWKSGHYSAAVAQDASGRYLLRDSNFGGDFWISQAALDEESSGYVLLGSNPPNNSGVNTQAVQSTPVLPTGWQDVPESEAASVWGGCHTGTSDPDCTGSDCECGRTGGDNGPSCTGCAEGPDAGGTASWAMATYSVHTLLVSLNIVDTPVGYAPPVGPSVLFSLSYSQREANQPTNFNYINFGKRWTCSWLAYVTDDPTNPSANASVYLRGGGTKQYSGFSTSTGAYAPQRDNRTVLARTSTSTGPIKYQVQRADGSTEYYETPDGATSYPRKVFLTRVADPRGYTVSLSYDSSLRLTAIVDTVNPTPTMLTYKSDTASINNLPNPDFYQVAKVIDPFGRFATFEYTNGELSRITDVAGLTSQFAYQGDFINQLTTPYGTTGFAYSDANTGSGISDVRTLEITDPLGAKERFEFHQDDTGLGGVIPMTDTSVPQGMNLMNQYLAYRNTFYWNKKSMLDDPSHPFTKAHIYHWLHDDNLNQITSVLESEKAPLESRIWYNYSDQPSGYSVGSFYQPVTVGRVLDDGNTQLYKFEYNAVGNLTKKIEPALDPTSNSPVDGRTTYYDYDASTGIDLLMTRQKSGTTSSVVLEKRTYDSSCPPHTAKQVFDASGQPTTFVYNAQGRIWTVTNAKGETTTYSYTRPNVQDGPADGYLYSVTGAVTGATTSYTYDALGRKRTMKDSEGYQLTYEYDALNRPVKTIYPDAAQLADCSFTQIIYERLDPTWERDRMGRWTHRFFDSLRHLVAVQDPLNRTTNYGYCLCGSMTSLTDASGNITQWTQDLQGRQTSKIYADGRVIQYVYEHNTSRLVNATDPMGQVTNYGYSVDNKIIQTSYSNALHSTPTVNLTYDPYFPRLATRQDGAGTTTYGFGDYAAFNTYSGFPGVATNGAGRMVSETTTGGTGMPSYAVNYGYDELGRQTSRSIDGASNQYGVSYDALGRTSNVSINSLGVFYYDYTTPTSQNVSLMYLGDRSSLRTAYTYYPNSGDRRLWTINNLNPSGATISRFEYVYNAVGDITNWIQQADSSTPSTYNLEYDAGDQLTAAVLSDNAAQPTLKTYAYSYDATSNRTNDQTDFQIRTAGVNNLNQITSVTTGGRMRFAGTVNKPSNVFVNGNPAQVNGNNFVGYANVVSGANTVAVTATDSDGRQVANQYQVQVSASATRALAYDYDGEMTDNGNGLTFEWDARNRLTAINYSATGERTEFSYDGFNRRIKIVERNGSTSSVKLLVWCGSDTQPSEERSSTNSVTRKFYMQGEQIGLQKMFYTKDHLGSVRELVSAAGSVAARYNYDPYGQRTGDNGTLDAQFGFTGFYYHQKSALHLAKYRAYDGNLGIWLSRDGLRGAEMYEGANLFGYVRKNPIIMVDRVGYDTSTVVCDGHGGFRIVIGADVKNSPILKCIEAHEQSHVDDIKKDYPNICQGQADGYNPTGKLPLDWKNRSECKAYKAEAKCDKDELGKCPSSDWEKAQALQGDIAVSEASANSYCNGGK